MLKGRDLLGMSLWAAFALGTLSAAGADGDPRHMRSVLYMGIALAVLTLAALARRAFTKRGGWRALVFAPGMLAWRMAKRNGARIDANSAKLEHHEASVAAVREALTAMCDAAGKPYPDMLAASAPTQPLPRHLHAVEERTG